MLGLELGQGQKVFDEGLHARSLLPHGLQNTLALLIGHGNGLQGLDIAGDHRQRGPQFVRDVGHKVLAHCLELVDLRDVAGQGQAVTLAIGHHLNLQHPANGGHVAQDHRLVPGLALQVLPKVWVAQNVQQAATVVRRDPNAHMSAGAITGVGDLVVRVQGNHPIWHGLGGASEALERRLELGLLTLIRLGQSINGGVEDVPGAEASGGLGQPKVAQPAVELLQVPELKDHPDHQAAKGHDKGGIASSQALDEQGKQQDAQGRDADANPETGHVRDLVA